MRLRTTRGSSRMQGLDAEFLAIAARFVHRRPRAAAELFEHHVLADGIAGRELFAACGTFTHALERTRQAVTIERNRVEQGVDRIDGDRLFCERASKRRAGGDPADVFWLKAEGVAAQSGKV